MVICLNTNSAVSLFIKLVYGIHSPKYQFLLKDISVLIPCHWFQSFDPLSSPRISPPGKLLNLCLSKNADFIDVLTQISKESEDFIVEQYKRLRQRDGSGVTKSSWRITVRQLESMIRLSEAMARMHCCDEVSKSLQHNREIIC